MMMTMVVFALLVLLHFMDSGGMAFSPAASSATNLNVTKKPGVWRIPLKNFKNTMYHGEIQLGSPIQSFRVLFATGSADTWVTGTSCQSNSCLYHHLYSSRDSAAYQASPLGRVFNLTYSIGQIHGQTGFELLKIGDALLERVPFSEITELDSTFQTKYKWYPFDGIVGLSLPGASVSRQKPLFDILMSRKLLSQNLFSLYLTQTPDKDGSVLILGGSDSSLHLDDVTFFPIETPNIFWMMALTSISLKESAVSAASPIDRQTLVTLCADNDGPSFPDRTHKCRAVIDSGTSLISGPSAAINRLSRYLNVNTSCTNLEQLPLLSFQFYGKTYSLHPEDYVTKIPVGDQFACFLALTSYDFPEQMGPLWVLGNTFLKKYYTVFDRERNQIGLALARP